MSAPIRFYAAIAKVATLADGGIRVYLDLPEDAIMAAAELMAFKRAGVVLDFVGTAKETCTDLNHATEKDAKGSDPPMDGRRITIRRDK